MCFFSSFFFFTAAQMFQNVIHIFGFNPNVAIYSQEFIVNYFGIIDYSYSSMRECADSLKATKQYLTNVNARNFLNFNSPTWNNYKSFSPYELTHHRGICAPCERNISFAKKNKKLTFHMLASVYHTKKSIQEMRFCSVGANFWKLKYTRQYCIIGYLAIAELLANPK